MLTTYSMKFALLTFLFVFVCASYANAAETEIPFGKSLHWEAGNGRGIYEVRDMTLTFRATGHASFTLTVSLRHTKSFQFSTSGFGFGQPSADFAVGRIDPELPGEQIILSTYSGGPHCCEEITVIEHASGDWLTFELPAGREAGAAGSLTNHDDFPKDYDGDGNPDFVLDDDRFDYAFASYTGGWLPPRIFFIRKGKLIEGSGSRKYDRIYRTDLAEVKPGCTKGTGVNGYCAGFVADDARLGEFESGWAYMLRQYDHDSNTYPEGCRDRSRSSPCPKNDVIKYKNFPEALAAFLVENGYITQGQASWALHEAERGENSPVRQ